MGGVRKTRNDGRGGSQNEWIECSGKNIASTYQGEEMIEGRFERGRRSLVKRSENTGDRRSG